nr:MAG TPA: hypothetical protein [Caudoviricetes sp.]
MNWRYRIDREQEIYIKAQKRKNLLNGRKSYKL